MKRSIPFSLFRVLFVILAVLLFAIAVMGAERLEKKYYLKLDVSRNRLSSLSPYTRERLSLLTEPVTVWAVYSGKEDFLRDLQTETLQKMSSVCPQLSFRFVDPIRELQLLRRLNGGDISGVPDGTCFAENAQKHRITRLEAKDFLFSRRIGEEIYTVYCGEACLIGGIADVCLNTPVRAVFSMGHGEAGTERCSRLALQLHTMGLTVSDGSLFTAELTNRDLLLIVDPKTDLTQSETEKLLAFLQEGGKLAVAAGADTPVENLTHLSGVLDLYGLGFCAGLAEEKASASAYYSERTDWLSPAAEPENGILKEMTSRPILPRSAALKVPGSRPGVVHRVLLRTSSDAVLHGDPSLPGGESSEEDTFGSFILACESENSLGTRIFLLSSAEAFMDESTGDMPVSIQDISGNLHLISGVIRYMTDREVDYSLDAGVKQLPARLIVFENDAEKNTVSLLLCFFMPALVLLVMGGVLLSRRRRA